MWTDIYLAILVQDAFLYYAFPPHIGSLERTLYTRKNAACTNETLVDIQRV